MDDALLTVDPNCSASAYFNYTKFDVLFSIQFSFLTIGAFFNGIFVIIGLFGLKEKQLPLKAYLFLINQSVCDFIISIIGAVATKLEELSADSVIAASFYCGALTTIMLCILKLAAVRFPFRFRRYVTAPKCLIPIVFAWGLGLLFGFAIPTENVAIISTSSEIPMKWVILSKRQIAAIIVMSFWYIATMLIYLITVRLVRKIQENRRVEARNLWKLGAGVAIFAVGYFMLLFTNWYMIGDVILHELRGTKDLLCHYMKNNFRMEKFRALFALTSFSITIKMIVDPIFVSASDPHFRAYLGTVWTRVFGKKIEEFASRRSKADTARTNAEEHELAHTNSSLDGENSIE